MLVSCGAKSSWLRPFFDGPAGNRDLGEWLVRKILPKSGPTFQVSELL